MHKTTITANNLQDILNLKLPENDANAATVRDYIKALALEVLIQEESFSGKRPFGNSDWLSEIMDPILDVYKKPKNWDALFCDLVKEL